ncbi:hypothetical protein NoPa_00121 [Pseudomonas phage vB_PpuM-NoPa]|uniref:Uncharacterized protein n=4 Tax=Tartuvirus TaxID=3424912 RepID=A0AAX4MYB8_9CAUD
MHTVKEKFRIVKVGRDNAREGRGHLNYPHIYEVYVERLVTNRVKVSGFLWWSKYTLKTEARWKYIGYHLSEQCAREYIVKKVAGLRDEGKVIAEFEM